MSTATIVSLVPFPIHEHKPGIYPGYFEIDGAGKDGIPKILNIGDSVFHVELDEHRNITVKCPAEDVAKAVCEDYLCSNLEFDLQEMAMPALFWVPGTVTVQDVLTKYSKELAQAKANQERWFKRLVALADDDWEKTQQHKFISDMQRHAAKSLGLDRPWIIVSASEGNIKCPACQIFVPKEAIVCSSCRCILDLEKYKKLQFADVK